MYRLTFLTALLLTISNLTSAQSDWWFDSEEREREITGVDKRSLAERSFKERLTFGGSGALQFGTNTVIGGAPQVGYRINESLLLGAGGTYYFQVSSRAMATLTKTSTAAMFLPATDCSRGFSPM